MHQFHCFTFIIRKLIKDNEHVNSMNDLELSAWTSFVDMGKILRQSLAINYKEFVEKLLRNLQVICANMSIKVHFLHNHQDKFPDNCGDVSDEQGERFHMDIKTIEEHYHGSWDKWMMTDYCWSIKRDLNNFEHNTQWRKRKFLP